MQIPDAHGRKLLALWLLLHLWILARERRLPLAALADPLAQARSAGFATDGSIFPGGAAP